MTDDVRVLLARALGQTEAIIESIRPEHADRPTPCPQWTVRDLVEHLVGADLRNFVVMARGETMDWATPPEPLGADWAGQFHDGAELLQATWTLPAAPPTAGRVEPQITELVVHGWDLLVAMGLSGDILDDELAEHALASSRVMVGPDRRGPGTAFGVVVDVPADAPAYARLAGWFGRDPGWRPPS